MKKYGLLMLFWGGHIVLCIFGMIAIHEMGIRLNTSFIWGGFPIGLCYGSFASETVHSKIERGDNPKLWQLELGVIGKALESALAAFFEPNSDCILKFGLSPRWCRRTDAGIPHRCLRHLCATVAAVALPKLGFFQCEQDQAGRTSYLDLKVQMQCLDTKTAETWCKVGFAVVDWEVY